VLKSTGSIGYFAEFTRNGEDEFNRTIIDYSHPQDPTMTSVYVRKNESRGMNFPTHNDMKLFRADKQVAIAVEIREDHFGLLTNGLAP
ncbi:hypothetical protein HDU96_003908, partial [Phlyctochytrium bullatum]